MRLTVGPLPAAVYWRRRAIVLGVLLIALILLYSACGGSSDAGRTPGAATATSAAPTDGASPEPTEPLLTPESGSPGPAATRESEERPAPTASAAPPPAPPPNPTGACTDAEMEITPVPAKTTIRAGTPMDLRLKIRNSSSRVCNRDVGAEYQELRLVRGAETTWSSDHCGSSRASDVRSFDPGAAREYMVTWNGKSSGKCANGQAAGPVAAGEYQLIGRLGTKYSQPVKITVTR